MLNCLVWALTQIRKTSDGNIQPTFVALASFRIANTALALPWYGTQEIFFEVNVVQNIG